MNRSTPASTGRTNGQSLAAPDTIAACRRPLSLPLIRSEAVAPGPEGRQTIAQRVSAGFRPQKNIQPRQGRQNPGTELELPIARDCPTARLFSTETGAGTDSWRSRRDILGGVWRGGREGTGRQLRRSGTRHPQVLEAGTGQPRDAGLRCGPPRSIVKWIDLTPLPLPLPLPQTPLPLPVGPPLAASKVDYYSPIETL